jgi:type IV pilus assembly protein PilM
MSEQALRKSIRFEAGKYISASIDDSIVEFDILGDAGENQMNVALVAAPKAMVDSRMAVLEQAGLDPIDIDVEAFAALRALVELNPGFTGSDCTVALLDIGASHTEINLVCKGSLALTRTIPIAGTSISSSIKSARNCTDAEAEQLKCSVDLNALLETNDGLLDNPALRPVQSLVDELLREIRRSINYYQSQLPDATADMTVDRLILTGGTSRLKGLLPYTNARLNVEAELGYPYLGCITGFTECSAGLGVEDLPLFTVALGLVMKEIPVVTCTTSMAVVG